MVAVTSAFPLAGTIKVDPISFPSSSVGVASQVRRSCASTEVTSPSPSISAFFTLISSFVFSPVTNARIACASSLSVSPSLSTSYTSKPDCALQVYESSDAMTLVVSARKPSSSSCVNSSVLSSKASSTSFVLYMVNENVYTPSFAGSSPSSTLTLPSSAAPVVDVSPASFIITTDPALMALDTLARPAPCWMTGRYPSGFMGSAVDMSKLCATALPV